MLQHENDYGDFSTTIEITPAPRGRLPWPGRWSRWWYEISSKPTDGDIWTHHWQHDGGGFSLRRCLWNAYAAETRVFMELHDA